MTLGALHDLLSSSTTSKANGNKPVTQRRTRNKTKVVFPLFLEWAQECQHEPFWYNFFENASRNVFPNGIKIFNNQLICELSRRKTINITNDNIEQVKQFLLENGLLQQTHEDYSNYIRTLTWSEVRKKNYICNQKITQWIDEQVVNYQLTPLQKTKLTSAVIYALSSGQLTEQTVVYQNNKILSISNIIYDSQRGSFFIIPPPEYKLPNTTVHNKTTSTLTMDNIYTRHCNYINDRTAG